MLINPRKACSPKADIAGNLFNEAIFKERGVGALTVGLGRFWVGLIDEIIDIDVWIIFIEAKEGINKVMLIVIFKLKVKVVALLEN